MSEHFNKAKALLEEVERFKLEDDYKKELFTRAQLHALLALHKALIEIDKSLQDLRQVYIDYYHG